MDMNERDRLDSLDRYDLLDTPGEAAFDRITRLAARVAEAPIALISLVDADRQWFKSRYGTKAIESARDISFCTHAIRGHAPFIVEDATRDPRFAANPLVVGEPGIRFYVGIPLRMYDGQAIGTLCAIDTVSRAATPGQIEAMCDLARLVIDEMELRQLATTDSLTGALTRRTIDLRIEAEIERSHRYGNRLCIAALDLDHFKRVNDTSGHAAGDVLLQGVASAIRATLRQVDLIGRTGGEEFLLVLPETGPEDAVLVCERVRQTIERLRLPFGDVQLRITASIGVTNLAATDRGGLSVQRRADIALYRAKASGRNCVEFALG